MDTNKLTQLRSGDPVAIRSAYGHGDYMFGFTVKHVTATGQIVVKGDKPALDGSERTYRFDVNGREMGRGASSYHSRLEPDVAMARETMDRAERSRKAANALADVSCDARLRWTWGKESMKAEVERLQALLATASAAVDAI